MVFKNICILVLWTKVSLALEELRYLVNTFYIIDKIANERFAEKSHIFILRKCTIILKYSARYYLNESCRLCSDSHYSFKYFWQKCFCQKGNIKIVLSI